MVSVAKSLEEIARSFRATRKRGSRATPEAQLALDIAVLSERLDLIRETNTKATRDLVREECRLGTDLLGLDSYEPRIFTFRDRARDNIKKRLDALKKERRHLVRDHNKECSDLQDRLFKLLKQRATLGGAGP